MMIRFRKRSMAVLQVVRPQDVLAIRDHVRNTRTGEVLRVTAVNNYPPLIPLSGWDDEHEEWCRRANKAMEAVFVPTMTVERCGG